MQSSWRCLSQLDGGWPESEQEHSHKRMDSFHQKREIKYVYVEMSEKGENDGERKRGCEDMKINR